MERTEGPGTFSRKGLPQHHGSSSANKENEVSGFIGFTQDECIEWDDDDNIDLRQLAGSPYLPQTPATCSSKSKQPSPAALRELRRNLAESNTTQKIVVIGSKTSSKSSAETMGQKTNYNAEEEVENIFHELEKEEEGLKLSQPDASETPTQPHENLGPKKTKPSATEKPYPQQFLATGVRLRKKRRGATQIQSDKPKRPNSADATARRGEKVGRTRRRPRSAGAAGVCAPEKKTLVRTKSGPSKTPRMTDPGSASADFEALLNQLDSNPAGKIDKGVVSRKSLPSDVSAKICTLNKNSSSSNSQCQMISNHPPLQYGGSKQEGHIPQNIPKTQGLESQKENLSSTRQLHNTNARPPSSASQVSQRISVPLNVPNCQGQKTQHLAPSTRPLQAKGDPLTNPKPVLTRPEENKAEVEDEFGELPEFSDADFAAMDALVSNATQPRTNAAEAQSKINADNVSSAQQLETGNSSGGNPSQIHAQSSVGDSKVTGNGANASLVTTSTEEDDAFGDFPDFDFDVMDKQIAERSVSSAGQSGHAATESLGNSKDGISKFSKVKTATTFVPPPEAPVRNPIFQTIKSEISFATFSRYEVLRIKEDTSTFTKILSVVKWNAEMNNDDSKAIHRSERQENSATLMLPKSNSSSTCPSLQSTTEVLDGYIVLRGEWYHTHLDAGDIVHLCSLSGVYNTDSDALPIVLHTDPPQGSDFNDDLVLVVHPDMLVTPTVISETISCSRRAVIRSRIGSSGKMARAALLGTMRHGLFEKCMSSRDFTRKTANKFSRGIVRNFADSLVGCGISDREAEAEVIRILPQVQEFAKAYTALDGVVYNGQMHSSKTNPGLGISGSKLKGHGMQVDIDFVARSVQATEECAVSAELGLKGDIDVTVEAETRVLPQNAIGQIRGHEGSCAPQKSLMGVELKTGHNQNPQNAHMAQLALYTLMLRVRHGSTVSQGSCIESAGPSLPSSNAAVGASNGGMLLYLNHESYHAVHVSPLLNELKSLIGQRNVVASEMKRASRPRGIVLSYDTEDDFGAGTIPQNGRRQSVSLVAAPPTALPEVLSTAGSCARCYANRECMMYARAEKSTTCSQRTNGFDRTHGDLLKHFTGHLNEDDIAYFRDWDRLVDLEADASTHSPAEAWLVDSAERERSSGKCMTSLVFDGLGSMMINAAVPGSSQENLARFLHSTAVIKLIRAQNSDLTTPLSSLKMEPGNYVIVSTDATSISMASNHCSFSDKERTPIQPHIFRHQMYVLRGVLENVDETSVHIRSSLGELERIKKLTFNFRAENRSEKKGEIVRNNNLLHFRLDKDEVAIGTGTLRQNLINLFTGDADQFLFGKGYRQSAHGSAQGEKEIPSHNGCSNNPLRRRMSWLRDTVVRLRPPMFNSLLAKSMFDGMPAAVSRDLRAEFLLLNPDQRNAVEKVMCAQDYSLIQGMPGTGKTSTISFVSRLLAARGKRVLVSSFTHAAVDNLMVKLIEKGFHSNSTNSLPGVVRLGQKSKCHPGVHSILVETAALARDRNVSSSKTTTEEHEWAENVQELPTAESLSMVMSSARIVGVTALSIPRSSLLDGQHFDVVIVDEAGQISQPVILGALMAADSFILVGDHMQLPPLVASSVAEEGGYGISMLKRLADRFPESVAQLTLQYRMHGEICRLCNDIVYKGKLQCANSDVFSRQLLLSGFPSALPLPLNGQSAQLTWLAKVIDPSRPAVFVNTDAIKIAPESVNDAMHGLGTKRGPNDASLEFTGLESTLDKRAGGSIVNATEVELVRYLVHGLTNCGLPESSIGVISPFRAQLRLFDDCPSFVHWKGSGLEVSTIDRFQGRDKPLIILSFVRSNTKGKSGRLLEDFRRLNVAVSRAKMKLIMVGSFDTLHKGSSVLRPALDGLRQRNLVENLPDNALELFKV